MHQYKQKLQYTDSVSHLPSCTNNTQDMTFYFLFIRLCVIKLILRSDSGNNVKRKGLNPCAVTPGM